MPIFAAPSQRRRTNNSGTGAPLNPAAADFTQTWNDSLHTASFPANSGDAEDVIIAQYLLDYRQRYAADCAARHLHMLVVFNLEPHVTSADLQGIFYLEGATNAVVVEPMPHRPHRNIGLVLFPQKSAAIIALSSYAVRGPQQPLIVRYGGPDELLPWMAVRLRTPSPPATLPWMLPSTELERVQEEMRSAFQHRGHVHLVAVHGLDPTRLPVILRQFIMPSAEGYEKWPPSATANPWPCRSRSAVVWYATDTAARDAIRLFDGTTVGGELPHPLRMVYLGGGVAPIVPSRVDPGWTIGGPRDSSTAAGSDGFGGGSGSSAPMRGPSLEDVERYFQEKITTPSVREGCIIVHNLNPDTNDKKLLKVFYPLGATEAEVYPSIVPIGGSSRRSGMVICPAGEVKSIMEKLNDFVPSGQTYRVMLRRLPPTAAVPSITSLPKDGESSHTSSAQVMQLHAATPTSASTPRSRSSVPTIDNLLATLREQLSGKTPPNSKALASVMAQIAEDPEACVETGKRLADVIVGALVGMGFHAKMLSTPLSGALMSLHEQLGIPMRFRGDATCADGFADLSDAGSVADSDKHVNFVREIARALIELLISAEAPCEARLVAAVLCAYLYQFSYLPDSPYAFAMKVIHSSDAQLMTAKADLSRAGEATPSLPFAERSRPWMTLMDCLEEMTSLWRRYHRSRAKRDQTFKDYEKYMNDFYGGRRHRGGAAGVGGRQSPFPSNDFLDLATSAAAAITTTDSAKRTTTATLLTPSARPIPRRVTTRQSPSTARLSGIRGGKADATPSRSAPQVLLTPASDYTQGISHDTSLDSNHPALWAAQSRRAAAMLASGGGSTSTFQTRTPSTDAPAASLSTPVVTRDVLTERCDGLPESTVYITKLPSVFTTGQVRRLLLYFGEITKVRFKRDDKRDDRSAFSSIGISVPNYSQLCYGFVEFAEVSGARRMVEYFRNAVHTPQCFSFLRDSTSAVASFSEADLALLSKTRASMARTPIHDTKPIDAVSEQQPCRFGLFDSLRTVEQYADFGGSPTLTHTISLATVAANAQMVSPPLTSVSSAHTPRPVAFPPTTVRFLASTVAEEDEDSLINTYRDVQKMALGLLDNESDADEPPDL